MALFRTESHKNGIMSHSPFYEKWSGFVDASYVWAGYFHSKTKRIPPKAYDIDDEIIRPKSFIDLFIEEIGNLRNGFIVDNNGASILEWINDQCRVQILLTFYKLHVLPTKD